MGLHIPQSFAYSRCLSYEFQIPRHQYRGLSLRANLNRERPTIVVKSPSNICNSQPNISAACDSDRSSPDERSTLGICIAGLLGVVKETHKIVPVGALVVACRDSVGPSPLIAVANTTFLVRVYLACRSHCVSARCQVDFQPLERWTHTVSLALGLLVAQNVLLPVFIVFTAVSMVCCQSAPNRP